MKTRLIAHPVHGVDSSRHTTVFSMATHDPMPCQMEVRAATAPLRHGMVSAMWTDRIEKFLSPLFMQTMLRCARTMSRLSCMARPMGGTTRGISLKAIFLARQSHCSSEGRWIIRFLKVLWPCRNGGLPYILDANSYRWRKGEISGEEFGSAEACCPVIGASP